MDRLGLLADEHVNRSYVSALRSTGYRVGWIDDDTYELGNDDIELLKLAREKGLVILTNDDDFTTLADTVDHAGIIFYQRYRHSPRTFVRGVKRIDRFLTTADFRDHVEWLENWL